MARKTKQDDGITMQGTIFACIGNGGSLTSEDVDALRSANCIAINDAWKIVPHAVALYAADYSWWKANIAAVRESFQGDLYTLDASAAEEFDLKLCACEDLDGSKPGLSPDKNVFRHGYSGGFQAMQLARMLGARKIILLGYDYGATGQDHAVPSTVPNWSDYALMARSFSSEVYDQLEAEGIDLLNVSRQTALVYIPRVSIEEALS